MASLTERIVFDSFLGELPLAARKMCKHVSPEEIPPTADLFSVEALETHLGALDEPAFSLVAGGDIMLGGRTRKVIADHGVDYPFQAVRPVLRRAAIVLGNLEGPFARTSRRVPRTHSYRVNPDLAGSLARAGICLVTLANNHLLDCGRAGVLETLDALARAANRVAIDSGTPYPLAGARLIYRPETR